MIKINLDSTYKANSVSKDLKNFSFNTVLTNGNSKEIHLLISNPKNSLLPNLFNLSFGPIGKNNKIDYNAKLSHENTNKVFSTILLFAISFLQTSKENNYAIGIDGSNKIKARFYHAIFKQNYDHLSEILAVAGVDCHAKLLWRAKSPSNITDGKSNTFPLFKSKPEPFDLKRNTSDLYQYYIFSLKNPSKL